jgi:hypothetical protein
MAAKGLVDFVLLSKYEFCSVLWGGLKLEGSNFVSLWPRRRSFLEIEGQYHFRPSPWYLLNLRWRICVSCGPFRFCVHILFFFGVKFSYSWQGLQKNTFDHLIFNFALPFWEHCALLCWYRGLLPFLNHYTSPEWVSNLTFSVGGSQATWV